MPEIRLEGITKFYKQEKRQIAAIRDVDLTVRQGEFLFVTGSSGAGKSTLLRVITGDLQPSRGAVYLDGISRTPLSRRFRERTMFGYVPQISQLMRRRTIRENLAAIAMIKGGRKHGTVQERVQKVLAMVGLPGVEGRYPVELSQGECRRVELARAIINSPAVLVLDELTANQDEDTIWDLFHLLEELNHRGTTVIMATHAKPFVNMLRKRVVTLVDGRVFADVEKGRYGDVVGRPAAHPEGKER